MNTPDIEKETPLTAEGAKAKSEFLQRIKEREQAEAREWILSAGVARDFDMSINDANYIATHFLGIAQQAKEEERQRVIDEIIKNLDNPTLVKSLNPEDKENEVLANDLWDKVFREAILEHIKEITKK
jgi:hypothetical protein